MQYYAVKGNREIPVIDDTDKDALVRQGYDIVDKNGNLIIPGRGKTVSYEQFAALQAENEALKKENTALKKKNAELNTKLKETK